MDCWGTNWYLYLKQKMVGRTGYNKQVEHSNGVQYALLDELKGWIVGADGDDDKHRRWWKSLDTSSYQNNQQ